MLFSDLKTGLFKRRVKNTQKSQQKFHQSVKMSLYTSLSDHSNSVNSEMSECDPF